MGKSPTLPPAERFDWRQPFVLFGAGNLGRRIAGHLRSLGNPPLAFCDNNQELWGKEVEGLKVYAPSQAVTAYPDAVFAVTIWHPSKSDNLGRRAARLKSLGAKKVNSFINFFLAFPDVFLPNMFWVSREQIESEWKAIQAARELFDERGQAEFDRQIRFRLGDMNALNDPEEGLQYFPGDFIELSENECFVDCGAFDGDTLKDFLVVSGRRFQHYIALEPEPHNRAQIEAIDEFPEFQDRVRVYPFAVGAKHRHLAFKAAGISSIVSDEGDLHVECVRLDDVLKEDFPTFIKMDIEGFEMEALDGGRELICSNRPKLAICVYHRPTDLWEIPLFLNKLLPNSQFTLRMHRADGFDTVCYRKSSTV